MPNFTNDANGIARLVATPTGDAGTALDGNFGVVSTLITTLNTAIATANSLITALETDLAAKVPTTRTVSTTGPLSGGGALSGNLTLSIQQASASQDGYLSADDYVTFAAGGGSSAPGLVGQILYSDGAGGFAADTATTDGMGTWTVLNLFATAGTFRDHVGGNPGGINVMDAANGRPTLFNVDASYAGEVVVQIGSISAGSTGSARLILIEGNAGLNQQVTIQASSDTSSAVEWTLALPNTAGTSGQFLQTNGAGVCSWASLAGLDGSGLTGLTAAQVGADAAGTASGLISALSADSVGLGSSANVTFATLTIAGGDVQSQLDALSARITVLGG